MTGLLVLKLFLTSLTAMAVGLMVVTFVTSATSDFIKVVVLLLFFGGLVSLPITMIMGIWLL